jgi:hypothetical protein
MTQLEGIALLAGMCGGTVLSGYWLAAMLAEATAAERLAVSLLAGLGSLLLLVAGVNFFVPLAWPWAGLCLAPIAATLLWGRSRRSLQADLVTFGRDRETLLVALLLVLFFTVLLWPMLTDPHAMFYDGTSNHDSFFWIANAEYLKRHPYMDFPRHVAVQPLGDTAAAIAGWKPVWGRMGAEGLLAFSSTLAGTSPLKIYLYATASLFLPWVATVFLTAKTFFNRKLTASALIGLALLQPVFIFFYSNANLPNLLGILTGAAVVFAVEQAVRAPPGSARSLRAWCLLIALSVHGLYCSYPEMIPFVVLPAALLWLRGWLRGAGTTARQACGWVATAVLAGNLINPATTIRAFLGFVESFKSARLDQGWANLFESLSLSEYLPALGTLSVPAAHWLDTWLGLPLSVLLVLCLFLALWRARDQFGAMAIFAGSAALLIYTLATNFNYGWQKTVQFGGVFVAAAIPVGVLDALARERQLADYRRWLARAGTVAIGVFLAFATVMNCRDIYKWSHRKIISRDWFALRELSRGALRGEPVVIDAATFRMAFFHGMWAAYFLPDSHVYYARRGEENGGYMRHYVAQEDQLPGAAQQAVLVARPWADAMDVNSPRLLLGREFALLRHANRLLATQGIYPLNGLPEATTAQFSLTVRPAASARLSFLLAPHVESGRTVYADPAWAIVGRAGDEELFRTKVAGPPPWRIEVPLAARKTQTVSFDFSSPDSPPPGYAFAITQIRIVSQPVTLSPSDGRIDFSAVGNWEDYHLSGLFALNQDNAVAGATESVLQFVPPAASTDVELELVAYPRFPSYAQKDTPLPVELWFNEHLVFSSPFVGPGVLRARIPRQLWNEKPVGQLRLRLPQHQGGNPLESPDEPVLVLRYLTTRAAASLPPH